MKLIYKGAWVIIYTDMLLAEFLNKVNNTFFLKLLMFRAQHKKFSF